MTDEDQKSQYLKDLASEIKSEYALGKEIMAVESKTVMARRLVPIIQEIINPKTGKKETVQVGSEYKMIPTPFDEPITTDLTKANLDQDDTKYVEGLLVTIYRTWSFADRYNRWVDCAKAANFLTKIHNSVINASRGKDYRCSILAKSNIHVQEEKSEHWVTQSQEEAGDKKKRWKIF